MKIEFHLDGPATTAWFASVVPDYSAAVEADRERDDLSFRARHAEMQAASAPTPLAEAEPVEAEKPKRTPRKTKDAETGAEPLQITTSPEDRKPVEVIEDAVLVEEEVLAKVYTRADMQDAMRAYQARMGMEATMANMPGLLGASKQSLVAEDSAVFKVAIDRINAALEADPNG